MKIHEYQAKEILARHGISVPRSRVASTAQEAADASAELGDRVVVKAQVHAGGRGKAGGIRVVSSPEQAGEAASEMLGTRLVTSQTDPEGVLVRRVLVEEAVDAETELYLGLVIDGAAGGVVAIASQAGGMEIQEVAARTPERVLRATADPVLGLPPYKARELAYGLELVPDLVRPAVALIGDLYRMFETLDCSLAEINPLVVTMDGRLLALDAKLSFDDDALFRHPDIVELHDPEQVEALESQAQEHEIKYVKLGGDVGCIVNGAGLAMATMDVIGASGAHPANFLDVGGGADEGKVAQALKIILSDPEVSRVLVNVFGGILRCDIVARGLIEAAKDMPDAVLPMVVRMLGTNADEGRAILAGSGLPVTFVEDLDEASQVIGGAA